MTVGMWDAQGDDRYYRIATEDLSTHRTRPAGCAAALNIGDVVRNGRRAATVTDVGTVLVAISTTMGARMVCPWELVRLQAVQPDRDFGSRRQ